MSCNCLNPSSSIGKKVVMAATGILLFGFLVSHLAGNMLLFAGPEMYNTYAHKLTSNPLIYVAEAGLALIFLYHVVNGFLVTIQNRGARPIGYAGTQSLGKRTVASSTMIWSGLIILFFVVIHIKSFKFGADVAPPSDDGVRDLYALVVARFQSVSVLPILGLKVKAYSIFYILCMSILGLHLSHAIQSSARTFGVSHAGYLKWIKIASVIAGIVFAGGFIIFPAYFGFIR